MVLRAAALFFATILVASGAGCQNACEALADEICGCGLNRSEQNACLEATKASESSRALSERDLAACESKLDTCSCEALASNDPDACGLTK
ncbi:MAG: hypothetical protein HYV07_32715 [Deltaproteobacteria bacterium]|nr:hypothetical protein [Deltaproteobacteria bacterium]